MIGEGVDSGAEKEEDGHKNNTSSKNGHSDLPANNRRYDHAECQGGHVVDDLNKSHVEGLTKIRSKSTHRLGALGIARQSCYYSSMCSFGIVEVGSIVVQLSLQRVDLDFVDDTFRCPTGKYSLSNGR